MDESPQSGWKPSPMTDEELDRALTENLRDDWPTMSLEHRRHYAQGRRERMEAAGLSINDPVLPKPEPWEE